VESGRNGLIKASLRRSRLLAFLTIIGVLAAFLTMSWWMPRTWYRALLYPGGRPNVFARSLNAAKLLGWFDRYRAIVHCEPGDQRPSQRENSAHPAGRGGTGRRALPSFDAWRERRLGA
jgi:hypothetical protein